MKLTRRALCNSNYRNANSGKDQYIAGFDVLRIILGLLVVMSHFWGGCQEHPLINKIILCIRDCATPTFMTLSFYFCYKKILNIGTEKLKKRIVRLMKPLIFWGFLSFIFFEIAYLVLEHKIRYGMVDLLLQLLLGDSMINPVLWFQWDLIILTVVLWIFLKKSKNIRRNMLICGGICAVIVYSGLNYKVLYSFAYSMSEIWYAAGIKRFMEMFLYAFEGMLIKHYDLLERISDWKQYQRILLDVLFCIVIVIICYCENVIGMTNFGYGFPHQAMMTFLFMQIFFWKEKANNIKVSYRKTSFSDVVREISGYTLGTYCSHLIVGDIVKGIAEMIYPSFVGTFMSCIIIYIFSFALCYVISKIPFKILNGVCT